ncbi:MAG: ABC transporter ATP-binding protein [Actinomycetaceae bacterium]
MQESDVREVLLADGLVISYGGRPIVEGFSLHIRGGETVALIGPSGSGKTSILSCVVGLQVPQAGSVSVAGHALTNDVGERARIRRELVGVAYQTPDLLPELSVEENVAITLLFDGVPRDRAIDLARASLASVGLSSHAAKRTDELSGGEAQRASIARALVRPEVSLLVADEPTASLDAANAMAVGRLIVDRARDRRVGVAMATHDPRVAELCDRVVELRAVSAG